MLLSSQEVHFLSSSYSTLPWKVLMILSPYTQLSDQNSRTSIVHGVRGQPNGLAEYDDTLN